MNIKKPRTHHSPLTVTLRAILLIGALAAPAGMANTYYGKIWGHVTTATDSSRATGATLPLLGIGVPVFEGDVVSGFYSYDSPTRDVDLFSAQNINITLVIGSPANALPYIADPQLLQKFDVLDGNLAFFSVLDASGPDAFTLFSASEVQFYLIEEDVDGQSNVSRLVRGDLSVSSIAEPGSTLSLSFLSLGMLLLFKGVVHWIGIRSPSFHLMDVTRATVRPSRVPWLALRVR